MSFAEVERTRATAQFQKSVVDLLTRIAEAEEERNRLLVQDAEIRTSYLEDQKRAREHLFGSLTEEDTES